MGFESYLIEFLIERTMNTVKQNPFERRSIAARHVTKPVVRSLLPFDWPDREDNARLDSALNLTYKPPSRSAQVAQLVEQRTENPCVGGSIPPLGTIDASGSSASAERRGSQDMLERCAVKSRVG